MILTVMISGQERDWFDVEVPDDCPAAQLKDMLGVRIYGEAPPEGSQYILEGKFPEGLWFPVKDAQDVAEAGLREGCMVRIQRAFSTTTEEAPSFGRRNLFQYEWNRVMES
ncbi:hypothetical protein P4H83_00730 [Paenibacillus favisporus]|uniref:hypothetical protein n=1 Tax=Paenibacillus favisporus TaxID=221028 RepID=UPI002DBEB10E|nr:hypothetical protein [Paenibacillus favisporus]MEC0173390.1 hypothetical protein [Paenibacillus favisporus]